MQFDISAVQSQMETIERIFREVQETFVSSMDIINLQKDFEKHPELFRSIAFESASMQLALYDLKRDGRLSHWFQFLNQYHNHHATQIYIGLGWALAQEQLNPSDFLNLSDVPLAYKTADGYGYYEGMFRRRKSILSQQPLNDSHEPELEHFDIGLGRSMWYAAHGNIVEAQTVLSKFPTSRQKNLWRGLGVAIAYVGGCLPDYLLHIYDGAGSYKAELVKGAQAAMDSRSISGLHSPDTLLALELWSGQ